MTYGRCRQLGRHDVGGDVPEADERADDEGDDALDHAALADDLPDPDADEQDGEEQQEGVHRRAAAAQLRRVGVAEEAEPAIRPPGRQLPKIMAARPM